MARVVVIGGGFGGLASALRLAKLGHAVTLVEQGEPGGALAPVTQDGFSWDSVTHTLLPAVVRDLFRKTGRALERELALVQLDCLREHWFEDGSSLVLSAGRTDQHDAFESLLPGLGRQWVDHVAAYADDWEVIRRGYAEVPWSPDRVSGDLAARLDSRETLRKRLRSRIRDERLRLVAGHPFVADGHDLRSVPAWAGLTAYLEQRFGAWVFSGGTVAMLDALVRRLMTRKVEVVRGRARDVVVRAGRAAGVTTTAGDLDADVVVCAFDPRGLPALASYVGRTMPAIPAATSYLGLEGDVRDLPHELVVHGDPTLVVRTLGRAPGGRHAWTVQLRGRHDEDPLAVLARHGLDVRDQVVTRVDLSPRDLVSRWGGTPLGVLWQGRRTVRQRLGPRTPIPGVYAAGSHATPGSGLPYVGLSAALVAQVVGPASGGRSGERSSGQSRGGRGGDAER
jgi:UDP-galactopyranose mutase